MNGGNNVSDAAGTDLAVITDIPDAGIFINHVLDLLGLDLSIFRWEQTIPLHITELSVSDPEALAWLKQENKGTEAFDGNFELKLKTDLAFEFRDLVQMENIEFSLEKYKSEYDFSISGDMVIFGSRLSFFMCYGSELFAVALSQCEQAQLKNLDDMGMLVKEENLSQYFPDNFRPEGKLRLQTLSFVASSDFHTIEEFSIAVCLEECWQLCAKPKLELSNPVASFSYMSGRKSFGISADLRFGTMDTVVYAGISAEKEKNIEWCFRWKLYKGEMVSLTELIEQLADALDVSGTKIAWPDISVGNVDVAYMAGKFAVSMDITVSDSRLFSSETKLRFYSVPQSAGRDFTAEVVWESINQGLTVGNVLKECGAGAAVDGLPGFLSDIGLSAVQINYDLLENTVSSQITLLHMGVLQMELVFGTDGRKEYMVSFTPDIPEISLTQLPIVGSLVSCLTSSQESLKISDLMLYTSSIDQKKEKLPAGVGLVFCMQGEKNVCLFSDRRLEVQCMDGSQKRKIFWLDINQTIAILSLYRLGVAIDGESMMFAVDAGCNVSPLTFELMGAGIEVCLSDPKKICFCLSGFGISFQNKLFEMGGELVKKEDSYAGELMIRVRQISASAIAQYSRDGSLMAFAAVKANFGGPPAFFVTGVSFGFGYNSKLLTDISKVADHPLIAAAGGTLSREALAAELSSYLVDEPGEKFLAAGIRFTSFGIIDSIAILTVNFGNSFDIGLIGLSELTIPPESKKKPMAYARLSLGAVLKPEDGVLGVEARLTSESYILSEACKLSGGFALYEWFAGENSGDMVIMLGGYAGGFQKPAHYPDVPRVGFRWKIDDHLDMSGEMYFALTPKEVMAGGRLNAVYTLGKLQAYFIAAVDFGMRWKPFSYECTAEVLLGASYRVDAWFVHHTFRVELGAALHACGPDFKGEMHVNWFILSFDIHFGDRNTDVDTQIGWQEFSDSFLPTGESCTAGMDDTDAGVAHAAPITISYMRGVTAEGDCTICRADTLQVCVESAIPMTGYAMNELTKMDTGQEFYIQPMNEARLESCLRVELLDEGKQPVNVQMSLVRKNLPSALWGKKNGEALVKNAVCGVLIMPKEQTYVLFPVRNVISLEQLYLLGTIVIADAFAYMDRVSYPTYTSEDSLAVVSETINMIDVQRERKKFLECQGIFCEEISLGKCAANAKNLFSENVMVKE